MCSGPERKQNIPYKINMDISIIIVNWNAAEFIRACVASIIEHAKDLAYEIIVVDNASPAGDVEIVEQIPEVKLIKAAKNLGFAGANNLGFQHSCGKYILFLNPDTELKNAALNIMIAGVKNLPDAGAVGCKLLNTDFSIQTSCIQTFPTILNQLLDSDWLRHRWPKSGLWGTEALLSDTSIAAKVEVISGACILMRREVFEAIGFFTEEYFMYAEDLDLCFKAAQAGYSNYYLGEAQIVHHGGKSSNPQWATQMKWKAILKFCKKHYGSIYALSFRGVLSLAAMMRVIAVVVHRFGRLKAGSVREDALIKWTLILKILISPSRSIAPLRADRNIS